MKKIILIIVAVVVAVGIGAGSFYAGASYQANQANAVRNDFMNARGMDPNFAGPMGTPGAGNFNPNGTPAPGMGNPGGMGGSTGVIKSIDGNTITLTIGQNEIKVNLTNTTNVQKTGSGSTSDLQTGLQVMVTGQRDSSGNISASQVIVLGQAPVNPVSTPGASNP